MSTRILGVGPGVVIIVSVWVSAFLFAFIFSKIKKQISFVGALGVIAASIVTAILLCIPREKKSDIVQTVASEQDTLFIWRIVLVVLELCGVLVAMIFTVIQHWAVPINANTLNYIARKNISLKI